MEIKDFNINKVLLKETKENERLLILKRHNEYLKIQEITRYEDLENNIYQKFDANDISSKIKLEINRIKKAIQDKEISKEDEALFNQILGFLDIIDENMDKEYLYKIQEIILKIIIELEIRLDIDIYLYKEYLKYYNDKIDNYFEQDINNIEKKLER